MPEVWEGWYCVCVMAAMFCMLLKNVAGPDILMLGALAMMMAAGTVDLKEGLNGFSNKGESPRQHRAPQKKERKLARAGTFLSLYSFSPLSIAPST